MSAAIEPFWMVYGIGQGAPTHRHSSKQAALNEASRLARLNSGVAFVVLEAVTGVIKNDVRIFEIDGKGYDDGIPF